MRNQQILDQVAGPKGCRAYEEKRAARLGFPNVYAYFEHKLEEKAFEANFEAAKLEHFRIEKKIGSFKRWSSPEKFLLRKTLFNI